MFLLEDVMEEATTLYNECGNGTMISNEFAAKMSPKGRPVKQKMVCTGGDLVDWATKAYLVKIKDDMHGPAQVDQRSQIG